MSIISRSDEMLLLTILRLQDKAYGVTIIKDIYERTGRELKIGALWVSLDNLYKKGYIDKHLGDPTPERGGKSKMYYSITPAGREALLNVREIHDKLWQGMMGELDFEG